jgi:Cdc6-like AAA superfamily ATPase
VKWSLRVTMQIDQYIDKKEASIEKIKSRVLNFEVFDFNYIPQKPLMREEVKPIVDSLLRYDKSNIPNSMVIIGSRGCGKTVAIKYLKNALENRTGLKLLYANCRQLNTSFKIISGLLGLKLRGLSLNELYEKFKEAHPSKTVLVMDEVDMISEKDKNKDIFYFLSRSEKNYMTILLSNNPRFVNSLDIPTRSSLQPEVIHFRNYNANEIKKILLERARTGLKHYNFSVLTQIAALTTQLTNSDVRVAIKTLYYWATHTERSVKECFNKAQKDIMVDVINDLNDHNILILKAVSETKERFVKAVYERYRQLCGTKQLDAFSYVYFYSSLAYLQSLELILLFMTKVNRAYTNTIGLTFEPSIIGTIYSLRFP